MAQAIQNVIRRSGKAQVSSTNLYYTMLDRQRRKGSDKVYELLVPFLGVMFDSYGSVLVYPETAEEKEHAKVRLDKILAQKKKRGDESPLSDEFRVVRTLRSSEDYLAWKERPSTSTHQFQTGCFDFFKFLMERDTHIGVFNRAKGDEPVLRIDELMKVEYTKEMKKKQEEDIEFKKEPFRSAITSRLDVDLFRTPNQEAVFACAKQWGIFPSNMIFVSPSLNVLSKVKPSGVITCHFTGGADVGSAIKPDPKQAYNLVAHKPKLSAEYYIPDITVKSYDKLKSILESRSFSSFYLRPSHFKDLDIAQFLSKCAEPKTFYRP